MATGSRTFDGRTAGSVNMDRLARLKSLRRLSRIARFMDTALGIPGTRLRFGADSLFGLIPVVGDAGGAIVGIYMVNEARKMGLPSQKLAQMLGNIATDTVLGAVPVVGDAFDLVFKSHRRNLQIILDHFDLKQDDLKPR